MSDVCLMDANVRWQLPITRGKYMIMNYALAGIVYLRKTYYT